MSFRKCIYLSSPISGLTYEASRFGWQQEVAKQLEEFPIDLYSPMRGKSHLSKDNYMNPVGGNDHIFSTSKSITNRDRNDCLNADLVFCNLLNAKQVSIGCMIELGWADALRIPIVTIMEKTNIHNHSIVNEISSFIVNDLDSGIDVVKQVLLPGL